MKPSHKILVGHVVDRLADLPDESIHCVVTSPPYFGLRSYGTEPQVWHVFNGNPELAHPKCENGHEWSEEGMNPSTGAFCRHCNAWRGSLGLEPTLNLFLDHMVEICREIRRVLRKDGTFWLNIGDSYNNADKWSGGGANTGKHTRKPDGSGASWEAVRRNWSGNGFKPKDLMLVPWRLAIRLQEDGWWVRSAICWAKRAPMPESTEDRPTSAWEPVFLLTKSGSPTYWTHRDLAGTRTKPAPDYRWVDHDNDDVEMDVEPPNWRTEPAAKVSRLGGYGEQSYSIALHDETGMSRRVRDSSGGMANTPTQHKKRWSRINLWDAHDYYFDNIAVQEDSETDSKENYPARAKITGRGLQGFADAGGNDRDKSGGFPMNGGKRNMRNFLLLGPSPFPLAHFATFPPRVPEIAILAGTSEKGVCPKCSALWIRIMSKAEYGIKPRSERNRGGRTDGYTTLGGGQVEWNSHIPGKTIGWKPTCSCNAGKPVSATILDPFLGAGTTLMVADRLGRNCIGIELSTKYAAMAERRLTRDAGPFVRGDVAVEAGPVIPT